MQRLLTLFAACLIAGAMAFGQAAASDQSATPSGAQQSATTQGRAPKAPSSPNQALPGNSNPSSAGSSDASANGQAVRPNGSQSGTPGTQSGNTPKSDNSDNNGMAKDDTGNNPASGRGSNKITNPGTSGTVQWFWIALGVIIAVVLIGALMSRNRAEVNIDRTDPAIRATRDRDIDRRDDEIRRAG